MKDASGKERCSWENSGTMLRDGNIYANLFETNWDILKDPNIIEIGQKL